MRALYLVVMTFAPAVAFAQTPSDPPPPPPPAGPPGAPPPAYAPSPAYVPPPAQPVYVQPAGPQGPWAFHQGVTFEANLGIGYAHLTDQNSNMTLDTDADLAGLDIGVGGWITPQLALTGRIAGVNIKYQGTENLDGNIVLAWVGPSLQYWPDPHFWFGGGIGFATYRLIGNSQCNSNGQDNCGLNGYGADVRAGYSFGDTQHTFNVSVELNPTHINAPNGSSSDGGTATSFALLFGYQYL